MAKEESPLSSDVGSTCSLPDAVHISCLSEQLIERVAEHIGEGYEAVGIRLGLPKVFIDRCKMSHSSHHMQVFFMLYTWRQTAGTQATVRVLMDVLMDSVHVCDVDMEAIVRLLKKLE
ncbi:death domain-containing protein CRADD-like [Haliotis cracherodii]|uniref:death domain-containing protein CRADD-like n=1 Tax=Haliotis cracherodii TaxID=6455 RepID=UPI0039E8D3F3